MADALQWLLAASEALGKNMAALDPDYFQKEMDELAQSLKEAFGDSVTP